MRGADRRKWVVMSGDGWRARGRGAGDSVGGCCEVMIVGDEEAYVMKKGLGVLGK